MKKAFILIIFFCVLGSIAYAEGALEATDRILDTTGRVIDTYNNLSGNSSSSSQQSSVSQKRLHVVTINGSENISSHYYDRIDFWVQGSSEYFRLYLTNGGNELYVFTPAGYSRYNVSFTTSFNERYSATAVRTRSSSDTNLFTWDLTVTIPGYSSERLFINYYD